jgi:hypothetical protein
MINKIPMKIKLLVFAIAIVIAIVVEVYDNRYNMTGGFVTKVSHGAASAQSSISAP